MSASAKLHAVEEIGELETAQRTLAAVASRLDERREKRAALAAKRAEVEAKIRETSVSGDVGQLGQLTATTAQLADAEAALLAHAIPALEAERDAASAVVAQIRAAAALAEALAQEPAMRKALEASDAALARTLASFSDAVVNRENAHVRYREVAAALAQGGRPVAVPLSTRKALAALGCGRGIVGQPGVERLEVPIPAGLPFS